MILPRISIKSVINAKFKVQYRMSEEETLKHNSPWQKEF